MPYSETYIAHLILKQVGGELTPAEQLALQQWRDHSVENAQLYEELRKPAALQSRLREFEEAAAQAALVQAPAINDAPPVARKSRLFLMSSKWMRYAAVLLILLGSSALLWTILRKPQPGIAGKKPVPAEIAPAGYKATLTLADGTVITLDSSSGGAIAQQGNSSVLKMPGGEIRYEEKEHPDGGIMMNTMRTPRGGQYRLVLPDGTKVWLNAASSITYPAAFTAGTRNIKITGEAYFEVAPDKTKPFKIDIDGEGAVEVLGTEFNINAYKDYGTIKTTLVNGKLRAVAGMAGDPAAQEAAILTPGQQAIQQTGAPAGNNTRSLKIIEDADITQVLAWKNGIFDFNGAGFDMLMKEVERWYDVDVTYEGAIPDIRFRGKMDRAVKLSGVMRFLKDYGVDTRLDERTLIIKENKNK